MTVEPVVLFIWIVEITDTLFLGLVYDLTSSLITNYQNKKNRLRGGRTVKPPIPIIFAGIAIAAP